MEREGKGWMGEEERGSEEGVERKVEREGKGWMGEEGRCVSCVTGGLT